jgi:hypothetical protein
LEATPALLEGPTAGLEAPTICLDRRAYIKTQTSVMFSVIALFGVIASFSRGEGHNYIQYSLHFETGNLEPCISIVEEIDG